MEYYLVKYTIFMVFPEVYNQDIKFNIIELIKKLENVIFYE